jgi:predicted metal-binding transcription factor (methanogenesis marker protein 9)
MAEMRVTKKAWQRADRLKRAGLTSDALKEYREDIRIINESTLSGKAKNAAKEAAARKFLRNEESRVSVVKNPKPEPTIQKIRKEAQRREEKQRPMDVLKKAWQRADRLKRAGISNDALAKYRRDIANVNKAALSREEKRKLKEEIAEQFLKNQTSTKTGIKEQFNAVATERTKKAAEESGKDRAKFEADYVDAADTSKAYLTARALGLSSDQVRYALDMLDDMELEGDQRVQAFMNIMNDVADFILANDGVEPDDVTRFINDWTIKDEG